MRFRVSVGDFSAPRAEPAALTLGVDERRLSIRSVGVEPIGRPDADARRAKPGALNVGVDRRRLSPR